jgi:hypothetical protein
MSYSNSILEHNTSCYPNEYITKYDTPTIIRGSNDVFSNSILNSIVRHPFVDNLDTNINNISKCGNNINIVVYRLNTYNNNHYVEFYLPDGCLISLTRADRLLDSIKYNIKDIHGTKRLKGVLTWDNQPYIFVQVRDNKQPTDWLVLWDIVANKHVYGNCINSNTIDFFLKHHKFNDLYIDNRICLKPVVLYCNIDSKYKVYVSNYKSIQYCTRNNSPLIELHNYIDGDNVRNLCFIQDEPISSSSTNLNKTSVVIQRDNIHTQWVFKTDAIIRSDTK